jgi:hypothetical protein
MMPIGGRALKRGAPGERHDAQVRGVGAPFTREVQAREGSYLAATLSEMASRSLKPIPSGPSIATKTDAFAEAKWTLTSSSPRIDSYSLLALAIFREAMVVAQWGVCYALRAQKERASFWPPLVSWSERKGSREPIIGYDC